MTTIFRIDQDDKNKIVEAITSLRRLVFLKKYAEEFGEDEYYGDQLNRAWKRAKDAVDSLGDGTQYLDMFALEASVDHNLAVAATIAKIGLDKAEAIAYANMLRDAIQTMEDPQNPYNARVQRLLDEPVPNCFKQNTS